MNTNNQIFTGIFTDEIGQRFLKIACSATDNAFKEVCDKYGTSNRLKECLLRVPQWNSQIIEDEQTKLSNEFDDLSTNFKQVYINYVKLMRGNNQVKIMVNIPKIDDFLKVYFTNISCNKFMMDGKFFERGPLDQRSICMECLRDALYNYLGEENVKIEQKKKKSRYFDRPASIAEYEESYFSDEVDSIIPDDSVSGIGYYERKKHTSLHDSDKASSESLSSVSLSQVSKKELQQQESRSEISLDDIDFQNNDCRNQSNHKKNQINDDSSSISNSSNHRKDNRSLHSDMKNREVDHDAIKGNISNPHIETSKDEFDSFDQHYDKRSSFSGENRHNRSNKHTQEDKISNVSKTLSENLLRRKEYGKDKNDNDSIVSYREVFKMNEMYSKNDNNSVISSKENRKSKNDDESIVSSKENPKSINDDDSVVSCREHRKNKNYENSVVNTYNEIHRKKKDNDSVVSSLYTDNRKNKKKIQYEKKKSDIYSQVSDSSEDDDDDLIKSPCKSYVTRLTEDSKMSCEN